MKLFLLSTIFLSSLFSFEKAYGQDDDLVNPFTGEKFKLYELSEGMLEVSKALIFNQIDRPVSEIIGDFIKANPTFKDQIASRFIEKFKDVYISNTLIGRNTSHIVIADIEKVQQDFLSEKKAYTKKALEDIRKFSAFSTERNLSNVSPEVKEIILDQLYHPDLIAKYFEFFNEQEMETLAARSITNYLNLGTDQRIIELSHRYRNAFLKSSCGQVESRLAFIEEDDEYGNKIGIEYLSEGLDSAHYGVEHGLVAYRNNLDRFKKLYTYVEELGFNESTMCPREGKTIGEMIRQSEAFFLEDIESILYGFSGKEVQIEKSKDLNFKDCDSSSLEYQLQKYAKRAKKINVQYNFGESSGKCDVYFDIKSTPMRKKIKMTIVDGSTRTVLRGDIDDILRQL
ncbi:hypothetical protein HBN50_01160 [Halobacteriovorax sp. GB3]|uniref:hypothetical protein n=1 Tax=Halobacteriovorax sp. GB3 TaxID=2719615 RepID=UPI0023604A12|nr:hypothetical protein [Halobacteriovorax sp. GB3]MDD0851676.1 hypothetical protein [Halobacteriovorax sp. GB3]